MNPADPFTQAIIQAATTRSNLGASPAQTAENAGQIANLQNLGNLKFIAAAAQTAGKPFAANSQLKADDAEAARKAAAAAQEAMLRQDAARQERVAATKDPANYQAVLNEAGGKTFLNGEGKPISVNEYARAKNVTIADALKDSQDPADIDFVNDYKDTMALGQIMSTGDKDGLEKFYKERPGLKEFVKDNGIKTWDQYVNTFRSAYKDRFSQAQTDATARRPVSNLSIGG